MEQNNGRPAAQWLDTATKAIRFGPDRRAVRAELEAHLEDKALDFQRIFPNLTREEAQERAAAEMGDPAEIGKELAKVHKPWLGWLWRASQFALGAAVVLLVLLLADPASYTLRPGEQGIVSSAEWLAEHQADSFERQPISGWEEQQVGQYNIQVKEARLWRIPGGPARAVYVPETMGRPGPRGDGAYVGGGRLGEPDRQLEGGGWSDGGIGVGPDGASRAVSGGVFHSGPPTRSPGRENHPAV